jgi:ankyrin repeat protein
LIQAADGEIEWVKSLLSAGTDSNGMPLMMAVQCNQPEIVQAMIKAGADVNFEFEGNTPLIHAISSSYPEIVEILIQAKADIHKKARNGDMPSQVAMRGNRIDATDEERKAIIQLLESAGLES